MPPQARQTYRTLNQSWAKPETAVRVKGGDGFVIADIPLSFLEASNSNTWDYVIHVVRLCVEQHGVVVSEDGQRVTGEGVPAAGRYLFVTGACANLHERQHWLARDSADLVATESTPIVFQSGPEGKSKMKAPVMMVILKRKYTITHFSQSPMA